MFTKRMNLLDLSISQLKRAAGIKEQIEKLNKKLVNILGAQAKSRTAPKKQRTMGAAVRKRIAAAQKARWAKIHGAKPSTRSVKPAATTKKKTMSAAAKAKLSKKLKAYWAAKKAGK